MKGLEKEAVKKIPLAKPVFNKEMERAAVEALRNERFVLGESVYKFEEEYAKYCGADYAVSMSSGTDALSIALISLGVTGGQEVVTSPASFVATANSALHANAVPVFADVELTTYTMDPERLKKTLNRKTGAVLPVHLYGFPANMDSIVTIAGKSKLPVVEDACQAHGALFRGRMVGCFGDVGCFSFYPSKNMMVAGDGGMMVTNLKKVAVKAAKLRDCGRRSKYIQDLVGYTARLNTVNAAIGRVQLKHLDDWNQKRRRNAERYDRKLSDIEELVLPPKGEGTTRPVYHLYTLRTTQRDSLRAYLEKNAVECGVNYTLPIHLQPAYKEKYGFKEGAFPNSEELCKTCLNIPMHPDLSEKEVQFVCDQIHEFFENQ